MQKGGAITNKELIVIKQRKIMSKKEYLIKNHVTNQIFTFKSIRHFCKINNLDRRSIMRVIKGEYKTYKGIWTLPENSIKKWKLKSPDGDIVEILYKGIRSFCRKYNLYHQEISKLTRKKYKSYKGWKLII